MAFGIAGAAFPPREFLANPKVSFGKLPGHIKMPWILQSQARGAGINSTPNILEGECHTLLRGFLLGHEASWTHLLSADAGSTRVGSVSSKGSANQTRAGLRRSLVACAWGSLSPGLFSAAALNEGQFTGMICSPSAVSWMGAKLATNKGHFQVVQEMCFSGLISRVRPVAMSETTV